MIIVRANARNATYISDDLITSGSVGIPVTFNLSEDFDGLSAIAVFEGSGTARDVALIGNTCVVPHEVVATAGGYLRIGIYAANGEGTIVIPTVWAGSKMILQGTEPSEVDPSEPTPSWAAQVQAAAAEAVQTSEEAIEIAGGAAAAADEARESATSAAGSATAAAQSAGAAGTAQAAAEAAQTAATSARDAAVAAQGSAENSAQAAAGSATAAAGSAAAAAASEAAAREVQESIPADYADLSADVVDLKSHFNRYELGYSDIAYNKVENEYVNTGNEGSFDHYTGWDRTDYIPVTPGETIYFNSPVTNNWNARYDENKNYKGSFGLSSGESTKIMPNGVYYIALSAKRENFVTELYRNSETEKRLNVIDSRINACDDAIDNLDTRVDALEGNVTFVSTETQNTIIQAKRGYNNWSTHNVSNVLSFAVLTDIHGDAVNFKRYMSFCDENSQYIDEKLCLGDIAKNKYGDDYSYWLSTSGADDVLCVIGNHDVWLTASGGGNTERINAYNKYFAPNISKWGVNQPDSAATNGFMYYYKDYNDFAVRLIVLDCMYWDAAEKAWFNNVLESALSGGLHVLIAVHYNPTKQLDAIVGCNFYSPDYAYSKLVTFSTEPISMVDTFIGNGGMFIGWMSGDAHYDACGVYTGTNGKQLSLTFENASIDTTWNDDNRVSDTLSQDSFNFVAIDTTSKLIKVVRIGNSKDRFLRSKKYLTFNYEDGTLVVSE